jgi:hypothetical protein
LGLEKRLRQARKEEVESVDAIIAEEFERIDLDAWR